MTSSSTVSEALPTVSIVMPCRREAAHIEQVLQSILATDYPHDRLEVLVVDGMSDDGTREIVTRIGKSDPIVKLVDNPRRVIPAAMNTGLARATGAVIVRMDAHTKYPPDYIRQCVSALIRTGADNVGGPCLTVPSENTLLGRVFALVLSHPFGVGNAYYKIGITQPIEVDAVPFGCMWKQRMLAVGPYNESLSRSEDIDFTARLRQMGGRTLLVPEIQSFYHARSRIGPFARHSLSNGYWISFPLAFGVRVGTWRHYVPLAFLSSLGLPLIVRLWWPQARSVAGGSALLYLMAAMVAAVDGARKAKDARMLLVLPFAFALLHLLYGFGTLWGLVRALGSRLRSIRRPVS